MARHRHPGPAHSWRRRLRRLLCPASWRNPQQAFANEQPLASKKVQMNRSIKMRNSCCGTPLAAAAPVVAPVCTCRHRRRHAHASGWTTCTVLAPVAVKPPAEHPPRQHQGRLCPAAAQPRGGAPPRWLRVQRCAPGCPWGASQRSQSPVSPLRAGGSRCLQRCA